MKFPPEYGKLKGEKETVGTKEAHRGLKTVDKSEGLIATIGCFLLLYTAGGGGGGGELPQGPKKGN